jgi:hypothetical protein
LYVQEPQTTEYPKSRSINLQKTAIRPAPTLPTGTNVCDIRVVVVDRL